MEEPWWIRGAEEHHIHDHTSQKHWPVVKIDEEKGGK